MSSLLNERLIRLKRMFRTRATWRVEDIALELDMPRTKVYELRDKLRDTDGIWLEEHKFNKDVPRGSLRWPQDNPLKQVWLSTAEVEALKTAVKHLDAVTPIARRALEELTYARAVQARFNDDAIIHIPFSDNYDKNLFSKVVQAIQLRKPARVSYLNAANELKEYEFYSYLLMPSGQHLHLVGMSKPSQDAGFNSINRLRLDQIQRFTLLKGQFKKPDFEVETYVDKHFGPFAGEGEAVTIRVQFSQAKAQYIRRTKRHSSQQTFDQEGGGVIWQITAPLSEYLVGWIVSYGKHARVLEPPLLRERVVSFAKGAVEANSQTL